MARIDRWDEIADRYEADSPEIGADVGPLGAALFEFVDAANGDRILDLGCGPGHVARYLARQGAHATGVDASPRLLAVATRRETESPLGIRYIKHDAADRHLLVGETFDTVVCSMALSDIDDLAGTLANVARLLRDRGRFVMSVLHPCFPGTERSRSSWPPAGYYSEGWWLAEGHDGYRGTVGAHHRTVSTYVNALVDHRLLIDRLAEPAIDEVAVPMFLVLRAIK